MPLELPRRLRQRVRVSGGCRVGGGRHQRLGRGRGMAGGFTRWRKYDEKRQALMKAQLERIVKTEGLSENVYEIVAKSLE